MITTKEPLDLQPMEDEKEEEEKIPKKEFFTCICSRKP